jgi:hypothetical protein
MSRIRRTFVSGQRVRSHLNAGRPGAASSVMMDRNRYVDLLRVLAIGGVVYGHWLLVSITYAHGRLSGANAIDYVSWAPWVTWAFQVMPLFFLVGGYVNARSWPSHRALGQTWTVWVRDRALRLLWPTAEGIRMEWRSSDFAHMFGFSGVIAPENPNIYDLSRLRGPAECDIEG